jgi:transcription termination factor Rho
MALPPKSDDDTPFGRSRSSSEEKKVRRPRAPRTRKAKGDKADTVEKPEKAEGAEIAPMSAPDMTERAAPVVSAPPEPPPAENRISSPPQWRDDPPPLPPEPAPASEAPAAAYDSGAERPSSAPPFPAPAAAPSGAASGGGGQNRQQHQGGGGGHQGGGGQQGEWQDRGDRGDRGFWKHGKRKRGRHGNWQSGGGGGGGGGGSQHPQQPAPAQQPPHFGDLPNPARFADLAAVSKLADEISSGKGDAIYLDQLYALTLDDLTAFARKLGVSLDGAPNRKQLLAQIFALATSEKRAIRDRGWIDVNAQGAFIVHTHVNYWLYPDDAYLPQTFVNHYGLKRGHYVEVRVQAPQEGERCPAVLRVDTVMGGEPEAISKVTPFEELVPYYPLKRILLENSDIHSKDVSMRAVDILTPIGFGQRGLIVAPPRTGKTVLMQNIANSISANFPEVKLILLLIDERPEEVTDFKRHTKGEVVSSTFDEAPESHVHCAEMVIEIARRRIEQGEHIVILLDSITRLARAYNALTGNQGKTMSGGLESNALQKPKRFFGSARNIEGGGSLTIIGTALIDTGSRMDEIIFEEFKGTGNSELHLDRGLVERRVFPAINIDRSGTRKEELIYHPEELQRIYGLRRAMQGLGPIESMEMLITRLKKVKSNAEFLLSLARQ